MQAWGSQLEPGFGDLAVLNLIDADYIHLATPLREVSGDGLLVDDDVTNRYPRNKLAEKIGFDKAGDMPLSDFIHAGSEKSGRECIILTVVGPPLHEAFNVLRIIGVQLHPDRKRDVMVIDTHFESLELAGDDEIIFG